MEVRPYFSEAARVHQILTETGALVQDSHFVYTTTMHGRDYINKDAVYTNPLLTWELAQMIAKQAKGLEFSVVAAPEKGGIILSNNVALALSRRRRRNPVQSVYAEKRPTNDGFYFGRGFDRIIEGQRVLLVEDTVNTGYSVDTMVSALKEYQAEITAIIAICNRGVITDQVIQGVPFQALLQIPMEVWSQAECLPCQEGVPINTLLGKGAQYLARKAVSDAH